MSAPIAVTLTVKYNANGGYYPPSDTVVYGSDQDYPIRVIVTLAQVSGLYRHGYHCVGWATTSSATQANYTGGSQYTYTFAGQTAHTVTLYAVWKKDTYSIKYMPGSYGSGSEVTDKKTFGSDITLRGSIFTRTDYQQVGWATEDGGDKMYDLGATYSTDHSITLYPVWAKTNLAYVKVNGSWKEAKIYIKVSGVWKEVDAAYVKAGGSWKKT